MIKNKKLLRFVKVLFIFIIFSLGFSILFAEENSHAEQKTETLKSSDLQKDVSDDLKEVSKDDIKLKNPETENSVKVNGKESEVSQNDDTLYSLANRKYAKYVSEIADHFYEKKHMSQNIDFSQLTDKQLSDYYETFENIGTSSAIFKTPSTRLDFYKDLPEKYEEFIKIKHELNRRGLTEFGNKNIKPKTEEIGL